MSKPAPVATPTKAAQSMTAFWTLAAALLGGTTAMRAAGKTYLPQWPGEPDDAYEKRLKVAVLFPAYKRTVSTLSGKPFSKPITIGEGVPEQMQEWLEDCDLQGRSLHVFASDMFQLALGYGMAGILVEYPRVNREPGAPPLTQAEVQAQGLRPYLVEIKPHQLLGWRLTRQANGMWALAQLRFKECVTEADGAYGEKEVEQVRVLEPGRWEVHRVNDKQEWVLYDQGATTLPFVPFVPVYGERLGMMVGAPPLLEVAHLNVAHWQSASDQQNILHVARVPILTVSGIDDDTWKLTVGASTAVKLPQGGEMKFVEHTGAAITAGKEDLADLEERMRQAGAELLVIKPGDVTATQTNTENAVGMCALQRTAEQFEDALDTVLQYMADWVGLGDGGHVTLFKDYGAATLAEASADLLLKANQAGKISDETFHGEMQRRGFLSPDVSWEEEQERLAEQGPALGMMGSELPGAKPNEGEDNPQPGTKPNEGEGGTGGGNTGA